MTFFSHLHISMPIVFIRHCTNSLSSLTFQVITAHFVHHYTLKQALSGGTVNSGKNALFRGCIS